jgi:hypothetical protein
MKTFRPVKVCNTSANKEHFTKHGLHTNHKGKFRITENWTSIVLTILVRNQLSSVIPHPWLKVNENSLAEHVKNKDLVINESELLK